MANDNLIDILKRHSERTKIGSVAEAALQFIEGSQFKLFQASGPGQSSIWVAKMYEIRMGLEKFQPNAFVGLEESIERPRCRICW